MKAFFERYSYESVRMFLNQFAISIFGFALAMTATKAESDTLLLWSSIASIVFYLALIYGAAWKVGSQDRLSIEYGKLAFKPLRGLQVSILANSLNLLMALCITIGVLCGVATLESIGRLIGLLIQGMYMGMMASLKVGGETLNNLWWAYFLMTVPAMLVSLVGYIAGAKNFHVTNLGIPELPESDRPSRKELREQKSMEKKNRK